MKYIMMRITDQRPDGVMTRDIPIVFPSLLTHKDVALAVKDYCPELSESHVVSAGFVNSISMQPDCHGASESIGVSSRGDVDSQILQMHDYAHGLQCLDRDEWLALSERERGAD